MDLERFGRSGKCCHPVPSLKNPANPVILSSCRTRRANPVHGSIVGDHDFTVCKGYAHERGPCDVVFDHAGGRINFEDAFLAGVAGREKNVSVGERGQSLRPGQASQQHLHTPPVRDSIERISHGKGGTRDIQPVRSTHAQVIGGHARFERGKPFAGA